jgi:hypothetical protein
MHNHHKDSASESSLAIPFPCPHIDCPRHTTPYFQKDSLYKHLQRHHPKVIDSKKPSADAVVTDSSSINTSFFRLHRMDPAAVSTLINENMADSLMLEDENPTISTPKSATVVTVQDILDAHQHNKNFIVHPPPSSSSSLSSSSSFSFVDAVPLIMPMISFVSVASNLPGGFKTILSHPSPQDWIFGSDQVFGPPSIAKTICQQSCNNISSDEV